MTIRTLVQIEVQNRFHWPVLKAGHRSGYSIQVLDAVGWRGFPDSFTTDCDFETPVTVTLVSDRPLLIEKLASAFTLIECMDMMVGRIELNDSSWVRLVREVEHVDQVTEPYIQHLGDLKGSLFGAQIHSTPFVTDGIMLLSDASEHTHSGWRRVFVPWPEKVSEYSS